MAMNINPQYTYDSMGNKIGVFLTMDQWEELSKSYIESPVEKWEIDLIKERLAEYKSAPGACISWEELKQQMIEEDGPL